METVNTTIALMVSEYAITRKARTTVWKLNIMTVVLMRHRRGGGDIRMMVYVVTADTYNDSYGSCMEILRVTKDETLAEKSRQYAIGKGWDPRIDEVELDKPVRISLGGYVE